MSGSEPLFDAEAMRALDAWAIGERGVDGMLLMEDAGAALADVVMSGWPQGTVAVVCGPGNNGGDGYVAARILREHGREVVVLAVSDPDNLSGDAATAFERLEGDPPVPFAAAGLDGSAVVVDAILGTGSGGAPRGAVAEAVAAIISTRLPVIAADVPTGVDAASGVVAGDAIVAAATVTFAARKIGLDVAPGKRHAGAVRVAELPYPQPWPVAPAGYLLGDEAVGVLPARTAESTKFTSGHVVVAGGSTGLSGAPVLAATGAMRAGAGYVTVAAPAAVAAVVDGHLAEAMTLPMPGPAVEHDGADVAPVIELLARRGGALVAGPGLGRGAGAVAFMTGLLGADAPLVIDADGLAALGDDLEQVAGRTAATVLTPHAGELARLLGKTSEEIEARRLASVVSAAEAARCVVVLKGDDTLIAAPQAPVLVSRGGSPALATAGTGDVLAGVIGAALAKGVEPRAAAAAAVVLHAEAGRAAAEQVGCAEGVVAGDVAAALPVALARFRGTA